MDAYYAGVEMKKHNIPASQPLGVLQWKSLIAINYSAKSKGVKRGMLSHEALVVCPEMKFAHVSTLCLDKNGNELMIPSAIVPVQKLSAAKSADGEALPQWKVHTRDQNSQKVSLIFYREESKKIFKIINWYSSCVEKAGCDEAFLNVTDQVNFRFQHDKDIEYGKNRGTSEFWEGAYFMPFGRDEKDLAEGAFVPQTDLDKKLFIANEIARNLR